MSEQSKIYYTKTDEAPFLGTISFLPVIEAFLKSAGIPLVLKDISLASRIIAKFPELLKPEQVIEDALGELGKLVKQPGANVIKLPNISASIPQLKAAIAELQAAGYAVPAYPDAPQNDTEQSIKDRYTAVLGSAVNPVLREGNSDRRVPSAVKSYAQTHPHSMGDWSSATESHVATMGTGDFFSTEQSLVVAQDTVASIEFTQSDGSVTVLKKELPLLKKEVIDISYLSSKALDSFFKKEFNDAQSKGLLASVHLKATMMKVSDPIIFGHAVTTYFASLFTEYAAEFKALGISPSLGLGDIKNKIQDLPDDKRIAIEKGIAQCLEQGPDLAMVNSDLGITNLDVPSDVIIDASMPAMIRAGGKMWGPDGQLHETKALIPDACYAGIFQEVVDFCKEHGAFDVTTMGSVSNLGLMAKKAEEYGSHDKTFKISGKGTVRVVDSNGAVLLGNNVEDGDIWRMCQTKDVAIQDWIQYAVKRAQATGTPTVFWLSPERAHDNNLITMVKDYLSKTDLNGADISIKSPEEACRFSLERCRKGEDTISVTGNVLRDYLTDLFPILEVGTSAKMLSIVPLLEGGTLFETGAGGSAPKHIQQLVKEGHLRWDSLGEYLALAVSLETFGADQNNANATVLAEALNKANEKYLAENKSPKPKVNDMDTRTSHYYVTMYWAEALAAQEASTELQALFAPIAKALKEQEAEIVQQLNSTQGNAIDLGGYYLPSDAKLAQAMRPSALFTEILSGIA
ncbi:MAG: NADP-dependent isocitrate dehydrogenase [Fibrobacterales bacterium]